MTTPHDPRNPDNAPAEDGMVRSLLWRLRARLVSLADSDRAQHDLHRILAAAKEHAHEPPSGHFVEFRDRVTPAAVDDRPTDDNHPTDDAAAGAKVRPLRLAPTPSVAEPERGLRLSQQVGRVAAVAVLVIGVGGGLTAAVDRQGTVLALFASENGNVEAPVDDTILATPSESREVDDDALAGGSDDADEADSQSDADTDNSDRDADETDATPQPSDNPDDEVADDTDGGAGGRSDAPTGSQGGADVSRDQGSSDGNTGSGGDSSTDTPAPAPDDSDDDSDDGSSGEDVVIALPEEPVDPGDLDGFGGSRDCPDGDLASCLPGDGGTVGEAEVEDPADTDAPAADTGDDTSGGTVDDDAGKTELELLAERRYGG